MLNVVPPRGETERYTPRMGMKRGEGEVGGHGIDH